MRNNAKVLNLATIAFIVSTAAAASGADSYDELYRLAKKNDSMVSRAEARLAIVKAESGIVTANLYPRVDASVGFNYLTQTTDGYNNSSQTGSVLGHNYALTARINALHVPTLMNLSAVDAGIRGEEAGVRTARQDLVVRFSDAYFGLLRAQQDYQIAQKEQERVKQVWEQSQAFLQKGTGDIIAVYEAKARLDGVTADLSKYESTLRLAEQKLGTLVGRPVSSLSSDAPMVAVGPQPESIGWWLDTMEKQDPLIRQGVEVLERSSKELKAVKAEHLPVIQASGGYTSSKGSAFLPEIETRQWYVGMSLSIPIFSGGETTARVQRAVASETERKGALDELRKQRSENLKQAYYNLVYNISLVKSLEQRLSSAELQLNAVKKGRSIGTRSAIDVLNAEQTYSVALRDYQNTLYDNVMKNILLKNAAGILDKDTAVVLSDNKEIKSVSATEQIKPLTPAVEQQIVGSSVGVVVIGSLRKSEMDFYASPDSSAKKTAVCARATLPVLFEINAKSTESGTVIVQDKQESWLKVACNTGSDSAWISMQNGWQYLTWKDYLKNRKIQVLPRQNSDSYNIYDAEEKVVLMTVTPKDSIEVFSVIENWALVKLSKTQIGWLRWKDNKGQLLVAVTQ